MLRHDLLLTLSAQIDRGRWFFPNLEHGGHGIEKGLAFQGLRQPALDCIVSTYRICQRLDWSRHEPNKALREELVSLKKGFVSEVQAYLDPRKRRRQFKAMTSFSASESHGRT